MDTPVHIDVHAHLIPRDAIPAMARISPEHAPRLETGADGTESLLVEGGRIGQISDRLLSVDAAVAEAAEHGIDRLVLSAPPFTLFYTVPPEIATPFAQIQNDHFARAVKPWRGRVDAMAVLPMQVPEAAATELRRATRQLGLKGAIIGSHIGGQDLDSPEFEPVWAEAAALGAPIFIHPHNPAGRDRMGGYHLRNLIGNPLDTALAATRLIMAGVPERYPRLKILLAHCGGYLPFGLGRLDHGYAVRPEVQRAIPRPPRAYLRNFWFDTITHDTRALRYAVETVGDGRVVLGSDYPFDMADPQPVERVMTASWLGESGKARILSENAIELFGLS